MSRKIALSNLEVRPVYRSEVERWNSYMNAYHYLGLKWLGGKSLRYIAHVNGEWLALLGWTSAAKNCGARERYIGWSGEKKYRRLRFVANNSRFLILPWVSQKNLASKVLSLNLKRLSSDFELVHGHPKEEILQLYPYLEAEDIAQALSYAAWRVEEIDIPFNVA